MSFDSSFPGWGVYRSEASQRFYLLNNGFVVGEVPAAAAKELGAHRVEGLLHPAAELDYARRKVRNLDGYVADLGGIQPGRIPSRADLRSGRDFRAEQLRDADFDAMPTAFRPRLVQLGNTGCYAYAHGGWRHVVNPTAPELELLKTIPQPQLVADGGLFAFATRERTEVDEELRWTRALVATLERHPDNDDVNRSYG